MKKTTITVLIALMVLLTSCVGKTSEAKNDMKFSLVIGISGIDDRSYNQNTWEGMKKYVKDNNISMDNINYKVSLADDDFVENLSVFSDQHPNLIVSAGSYFNKPVKLLSEKYPKQKYLLMDTKLDVELDNVLCITFAPEQSSYLVGVAAALKTQELGLNKVGMICGDDATLHAFEAGFEAGVAFVDKNIKVETKFSNEFCDPIKGAELASEMYENGIGVIFNVSGETGVGIIKEAKKRAMAGENVWVVGVDMDQYQEGKYESNKSVILTSALKKLSVAVYDTMDIVAKGQFKGGHVIYNLKNKGVGIPDKNPNLTEEWLSIITKCRADIINDKLVVPKVPTRLK